ncbi:MAG: flagellar hook basal-body protein, partial [Candidatus Omnitrophica bacterium]|nr:flagellar hook basal-body protein [Candidatus Omnitrophota bacterium]
MITGLYAASTNLDAIIHQQDAIAGNIANAGVSGHKGETVVFRSFPDIMFEQQSPYIDKTSRANHVTGRIGTGVGVDWSYMNFQPGPLEYTGVNTDLTIDGDGFFMVETANGPRLTRNSKYTIQFNEDRTQGTLVTHEGYPLLGQKGQIKFPADQDLKVDAVGNVVAGNVVVDRLQLKTVPDKNVLLPESGALFNL